MLAVAGLGLKVRQRFDVEEHIVLDAFVVPCSNHISTGQLLVCLQPPQIVGQLEVFLLLPKLPAAVVGRR